MLKIPLRFGWLESVKVFEMDSVTITLVMFLEL